MSTAVQHVCVPVLTPYQSVGYISDAGDQSSPWAVLRAVGLGGLVAGAAVLWTHRVYQYATGCRGRAQTPLLTDAHHGGDLVAEVLVKHNVRFLFTLIGGHVSPVLVGSKRRGIRVIDVRHEVNAVFAADAVSRLSDSVGVACVTAGPGLTNTITAAKNALMAQSPLVILGGATLNVLKGRGSLQDIDQQTLFRGNVKWQVSISRVCDIIPSLEEAFRQAQSGVPGPVFVELPLDVLYPEAMIRRELLGKFSGKTGVVATVTQWYLRYYLWRMYGGGLEHAHESAPLPVQMPLASDRQVARIASMLLAAERPVVVAGSQAVARHELVEQVVAAIEAIGAPVFLAGGARGCLGANSELHMRHKRSAALKRADVVLLLGVPADFRLNYGFAISSRAQVIGVNVDRESLYLNRTPTVAVLADVGNAAVRIGAAVAARTAELAEARGRWDVWRTELRATCDARDAEIVEQAAVQMSQSATATPVSSLCNPLAVCRALDAELADQSVLVCDGGDFIGTAAYTVRPRGPRSWLDPGPFGTLGVGAGFALGAKLVRPDAEVWLLWGDGSAGYSIMEYDTFVRHGVNVIAVIGNDACWRQIHRDQVTVFDDDVGCMLAYNDYHKVVDALGARGHRVDKVEDLPAVLKAAKEQAKKVPVLINVMIGKISFRDGSISV